MSIRVDHSSATERKKLHDEEQRWFLSRKLVARLVKSWAKTGKLYRGTKLCNTVAEFCCVSGMGLSHTNNFLRYNSELAALSNPRLKCK